MKHRFNTELGTTPDPFRQLEASKKRRTKYQKVEIAKAGPKKRMAPLDVIKVKKVNKW